MCFSYSKEKSVVDHISENKISRDKNSRIAIIGAGAAGLTTAETLKERGYAHVTVFERSERVGGKCFSIAYQNHTYELGAGVIAGNNYTVLGLAKKYHVPYQQIEFGKSVVLSVDTGRPVRRTRQETLQTARELLRYKRLLKPYAYLAEPGLAGVTPEVCVPFSQWAREHHVERIAREFALFFTGFGYAYFDDVPAAYVLKYYSWGTLKSFIRRKMYTFPGGIQQLWTTVATHHDIRYNSAVKKITRGDQVVITVNNEQLEFDEVIFTSALDEALQYIDARQEEKDLFSKIIYCDYRTYACIVNGLPHLSGYLPLNFTSTRPGHPVFWYQRHTGSPLTTFYVLGDWKMTDVEVMKNIQAVVQQQGGTIERVHTTAYWKYFPHVSSEDMRAGYFDRLESIQGTHHSWYAGEFLNFSTVELSSAYAKKLIATHF